MTHDQERWRKEKGRRKVLLVLRCAVVVVSLACQPYARRRDSAGSAVTKQQ
jgi:hypothetical protein